MTREEPEFENLTGAAQNKPGDQPLTLCRALPRGRAELPPKTHCVGTRRPGPVNGAVRSANHCPSARPAWLSRWPRALGGPRLCHMSPRPEASWPQGSNLSWDKAVLTCLLRERSCGSRRGWMGTPSRGSCPRGHRRFPAHRPPRQVHESAGDGQDTLRPPPPCERVLIHGPSGVHYPVSEVTCSRPPVQACPEKGLRKRWQFLSSWRGQEPAFPRGHPMHLSHSSMIPIPLGHILSPLPCSKLLEGSIRRTPLELLTADAGGPDN